MGWKNVQEHYKIGHIVQVIDGRICIGGDCDYEMIVIDKEGTILKRWTGVIKSMRRYLREMDADPEKLKELVRTPDSFDKSTTVYTFDHADIIETQCEKYGFPYVTHDGLLMYPWSFFLDRNDALEAAIKKNRNWGRALENKLKKAEERLAALRIERERQQADKISLDKQLAASNKPEDTPGIGSSEPLWKRFSKVFGRLFRIKATAQ